MRRRMVAIIGRVQERSAYVSNSTTGSNEENLSVAVFAAFSRRVFSFLKVSAVDFFSEVARSSFSRVASAGAMVELADSIDDEWRSPYFAFLNYFSTAALNSCSYPCYFW